jgi:hypothetical protein
MKPIVSIRHAVLSLLVLLVGAAFWWALSAADRGARPTRAVEAAPVEREVRADEPQLAAVNDPGEGRSSTEVTPEDEASDVVETVVAPPVVAAPEHTIRVLVTDESGAPLAAANVGIELPEEVLADVSTDASGHALFAVHDAFGSVRVHDVFGSVHLRVRHTEYGTHDGSVAVTDPIVVVLRPPCTLTVTCIEVGTGAPLPDVDVEWSMDGRDSSGFSRSVARSDVRGQVSFGDVPTNTRIRLRARGIEVYLQRSVYDTTAAPRASMTLSLRRGQPVRMHVFDEHTGAAVVPTVIDGAHGARFGWRQDADGLLVVYVCVDEWNEENSYAGFRVAAEGCAVTDLKGKRSALSDVVHVPMRALRSVAFVCDELDATFGSPESVTVTWGRSLWAIGTPNWTAPYEAPPGDDTCAGWTIHFAGPKKGPRAALFDHDGVALVAGLLSGVKDLEVSITGAAGASLSGRLREELARPAGGGVERFRVRLVAGEPPKLDFTRDEP